MESPSSIRGGGKILICVWAFEVDPLLGGKGSARKGITLINPSTTLDESFTGDVTKGGTGTKVGTGTEGGEKEAKKDRTREEERKEGEGEGVGEGEQDVFVPWRLQPKPRIRQPNQPRTKKPPPPPSSSPSVIPSPTPTTLKSLVTGISPSEAPPSQPDHSKVHDPQSEEVNTIEAQQEGKEEKVFQRYYHLFKQGELTSLVHSATHSLGGIPFPSTSLFPPSTVSSNLVGTNLDNLSIELAQREEEGGRWRMMVEIEQEKWERENWTITLKVGWSFQSFLKT